jgi:mono/diheme cytochrome c family protein
MTLIKNFYFTDVSGSEKIVETRFLSKTVQGLKGYSYKWNQDQTDATLVGDSGESLAINAVVDGEEKQFAYKYPSKANCQSCHNSSTPGPLAFIPKQLHLGANGAAANNENQIQRLFDKNILSSAALPTSNIKPYSKTNLVDSGKSYLEVHCASCHNTRGGPGLGVFSFSSASLAGGGYCNVKAVSGSEAEPLIHSSKPLESYLYGRLLATDSKRMPKDSGPLNHKPHLDAVAAWMQAQNCN